MPTSRPIAWPSRSILACPAAAATKLCGFYDVSPSKFGLNQNVISQASHFGTQQEVYDGFDVGA